MYNMLKDFKPYDKKIERTKSSKTIVRSIRASKEFWEKVEQMAKNENTDTNKLVVKVVKEYCEKEVKNGANN